MKEEWIICKSCDTVWDIFEHTLCPTCYKNLDKLEPAIKGFPWRYV